MVRPPFREENSEIRSMIGCFILRVHINTLNLIDMIDGWFFWLC